MIQQPITTEVSMYTTSLTSVQALYSAEVTRISKEIVERARLSSAKNKSSLLSLVEEYVNDSEWTLSSSKIRAVILCSENWNTVCESQLPLIISGNKKSERNGAVTFLPDFLPLEQIAFHAMMQDVELSLKELGVSFDSEDEGASDEEEEEDSAVAEIKEEEFESVEELAEKELNSEDE
jgi:hypothetical protein